MRSFTTWIKYLPALFFFVLWIQFIDSQLDVEQITFTSPIGSLATAGGLDRMMDMPWQQKGAQILYFSRLAKERVSEDVWLNSEMYARSLWVNGQFPGALEALIKIAVIKNNRYDIDRFSSLYLAAYPNHPFSRTILNYLRSRPIARQG